MAKESVLQIRIDSGLKEAAEAVYRGLGTSLSEAVRIFARQSVIVDGMPFTPHFATPRRREPSSFGAFAEYANPKLRGKEKGAFARAMEAKHAHSA